jgi:hypothetical protein
MRVVHAYSTGHQDVSTRIGPGFKVTKDGKIVKDKRAVEAKLDLCTRLKRRSSERVRVAKRGPS